jgi:(2Fe-2S) ferredoxin
MSLQDPAPYYRMHAFVCTNERDPSDPRGCCAARGSVALRDYLKQAAKKAGIKGVRINNAGCLDRCELGPVLVIYPEGIWYAADTTADIDEIIETHLIGGKRVERLMLQPTDRRRERPALAELQKGA